MRVWLLQGRQGEDPAGLGPLLRSWAESPNHPGGRPEVQLITPIPVGQLPSPRADLLVAALALCPSRDWLEEVLAKGVGVLASGEAGHEHLRLLSESHPLFLVPPHTPGDFFALALVNAACSVRRERHLRTQLELSQQRLNDRIVIERAKGILVQRLNISEEEAYKRLRVQSRRQRRQIREVAQSFLDSQALLTPDPYGLLEGDAPPNPGPNGDHRTNVPSEKEGARGADPANPANPSRPG